MSTIENGRTGGIEMTVDTNKLRRVAVDCFWPTSPVPISDIIDRLEAAEKEREIDEQRIADLMAELNRVGHENDKLRAKIEAMEEQEPVGVLHVGSYYGEELQDWEFEANQCACDKLNEAYVSNPTSLPLYVLPGAKGEEK